MTGNSGYLVAGIDHGYGKPLKEVEVEKEVEEEEEEMAVEVDEKGEDEAVELDEETVKKGKFTNRTGRQVWTPQQTEALCKAWCHIFEDPTI
ncbi:hypothetical protein L1987_17978 [Smallanthus sonchifolius]|uniref:Uncharacterized protein n=1 Tax=Smallanthus sonchifolius TaxID=185202 RepID=A0ACB9J0M2_9ASTR|nr:hypothetical protein L1987_17978 [Smallanthus sonchifolius]